MKLPSIAIASLTVVAAVSCNSKQEKQTDQQQDPTVEFVKQEANNSVDVIIDGKLFTTYRWPDDVYKRDHPDNISYPTYWHARGYGLFAANPFGAKDFTEGKEELNHKLAPGESLTFKYRIIINSGNHLTDAGINKYAGAFATNY